MSVINGSPTAGHKPLLDTALGIFAPKQRASARVVRRQRRRAIATWFRAHGRRIKEGAVAAVACAGPLAAAYEWHFWLGLILTGAAVLVVDKAADPTPPKPQGGG